MAMTEDLEQAFNDQITLEFSSEFAYLQMAAYFEQRDLSGFAEWMRLQAAEEHTHGMKFFDFLLNRGNTVTLGALDAPKSGFGSVVEVFEASLAQEKRVTASIHDLYARCSAVSEYQALPLLHWFIDEQVEEESSVSKIVEQVRMAGSDGAALLFLDRELGERGPTE
ncbi:MAG: ferritin [Acidimicrobiia bacterium]